MKLSQVFVCLLLFALLGAGPLDNGHRRLRAKLTGFSEVPSKSTTGKGTFRATFDPAAHSVTYTVTYSDLTGPATASHIHFGQEAVNGGIAVFFCDGAGHPACPPGTSGTITGTFTAADVITVTGQGINAGDFDKLIEAIQAGKTYANVHTALFPGGEIRGQIRFGDDEDDDH